MLPPDSTPSVLPLLAAEALLSAIIDSSDDAIISKSLDSIITSWNRSAEKMFGYSSAEAIGKSITMILPEDRLSEEITILTKVKAGERVDHFETLRRRKNGELIDVSLTVSPIRGADGRIVGASKVIRDITEQKLGGRAALLLASIVNSSEDAIISKNLSGIITSWNHGAERMFGYTEAETVGKSVLMLVPEERKEEEPHILSRLRRGERFEHFETIRLRKNGERFPVSLTISPMKNAAGTIVGASKIARDISDLRRISDEREQLLESERAARAQAEHANRMKDDFIATVSHELRTPLNAIVGWTQVLKESALDPATAEGLVIIERNARVQTQLIDDLLDLNRLTTGKMRLELERVEVGAIVRASIESIQPTAEAKKITMSVSLEGFSFVVIADKQRLQQVFWNLLSNAVKFTPAKGNVTIKVTQGSSTIDVTVSDNGCGIAPDFLPYVFERFRQADASTTRRHGGLGIGLALVKQVIELHQGEVRAESAGLGLGATFTVTLRASASPSGQDATAESPQPQDTFKGLRILAVDDDRDSLEIIRRILSARLAVVETSASVEDALAKLATFRPHVVLTDIGMPGQDGYELIGKIREMDGAKNLPVIAVTAFARPEDRARMTAAGFHAHIAKPVRLPELIDALRRFLPPTPA